MTNFWTGKKVLLTGHTGFKGSWLAEILLTLGAKITGCALESKRNDDLFHLCKLENRVDHRVIDIRDKKTLLNVFEGSKPDVVFHLAAQPLVLESFDFPLSTWETNVIGSLNVMECLREINKICAVVMVTTDKVYEQSDDRSVKIESDHLGGHDPYSSSKAAMEIAVASWRRSFFQNNHIKIATARAGNVIGGGDWSDYRLVPDLINALQHKSELIIRNPSSVRPWQHILEPLFGYIKLAEFLYQNDDSIYQTSFNFGPDKNLIATVADLIAEASKVWGGEIKYSLRVSNNYESQFLFLDSTKAQKLLGWNQQWNFNETIAHTVNWYKNFFEGNDASSMIKEQINAYIAANG
jgi:CDP-glucose 4,6-dehydratase